MNPQFSQVRRQFSSLPPLPHQVFCAVMLHSDFSTRVSVWGGGPLFLAHYPRGGSGLIISLPGPREDGSDWSVWEQGLTRSWSQGIWLGVG